MESNQDKVSVGMTVKIGLPKYSSADVHISYESVAKPGETKEELYTRVSSFVEERLREAEAKLVITRGEPNKEPKAVQADEEEEAPRAKTPFKKLGGLSKLKFKTKKQEAPVEEETEESDEEVETELEARESEEAELEAADSEDDGDEASEDVQKEIEKIKAKYGMTKPKTDSGSAEGSSLSKLKR